MGLLYSYKYHYHLYLIKITYFLEASWIAFVQKCSRFGIWHSSDLDSAGPNCPKKSLNIYFILKNEVDLGIVVFNLD